MSEEIINKVAEANIEQIDLSSFLESTNVIGIDLREQLWEDLVLKEKEFRTWIMEYNWEIYADKNVTIYCSNDAIIPAWAYMLVTSKLSKAKNILFGTPNEAKEELFFSNLNAWDISHLKDKRVMVKGCSNIPNPNKAYLILTKRLIPHVKSLMFGEPCSAVPVYKKK